MSEEEIKELTAEDEVTSDQKILKAKPLWWFQEKVNYETPAEALKNGRIFCAEEFEAGELLNPKHTNWRKQNIVCLGWSDGMTLQNILKEATKSAQIDLDFNDDLRKQKEEIVEKEKYLLRDQKLDAEDIRIMAMPFKPIKNAREIIAKNYQRAFNAEFAKAQENLANKIYTKPIINKVSTPGVQGDDRNRILNSWGFI